MSRSLSRKIMLPACLMTLTGAIVAAWAFSSYAGFLMERTAARESQAALNAVELVLASTDRFMADRVAAGMKDLRSEIRKAGRSRPGAR